MQFLQQYSRTTKAAEIFLIIFLFFLVYYFSIPASFNTIYENRRFFDSDGEFIVRQFRENSTYTHNDHILYHVIARFLYNNPKLLGLGRNPIRIHRFMSIFSGSIVAGLSYWAGRKILNDRFFAFAFCSIISFSAGQWFFAATIDTYVPCLFFSFASLLTALYAINSPKKFIHILLGAVMGISFLLRTDSFLLAVLLLIYITDFTKKWRLFLLATTSGLLVGIVGYFLLAHMFYEVPFTEVVSWAMGGVKRPESRIENSWGNISNFSFYNISVTIVNHLFYNFLMPHIEKTRTPFLGEAYNPVALLTSLPIVILFVWFFIVKFIISVCTKPIRTDMFVLFIIMLLWIVLRVAFYCWWDPFDPFLFTTSNISPVWLMTVLGIKESLLSWKSHTTIRIFALLVAATMFFHNLLFLIIPIRSFVL